jgi:hypothetical protein
MKMSFATLTGHDSLSGVLRSFADKLESDTLNDSERSGIATALLLISEEIKGEIKRDDTEEQTA